MPSSTPKSTRFYIVDDGTISVARDHPAAVERESSFRKRKRQRVDVEEVEGLDGLGATPASSKGDGNVTEEEVEERPQGSQYNPLSYVRDPDYYVSGKQKEDEAVVRVMRTLFKVPKSMLQQSHHLCAIANNFKKCFDDSEPLEVDLSLCRNFDPASAKQVETFRSILWGINVLHGGDQALLERTPATYEEVERILSVSPIARDLSIPSWEAWAAHTAGLASKDDTFLDSCSSAILRLLIQVASSASPPLIPIIERVATTWVERVLTKKAPSVPAILAAEAYSSVTNNPYVPEVRALCGIAYYVHLQDMEECQTFEKDGIVTGLRADSKLTNEQVMRLFAGHYSLVRFWQRFRLDPVKIPLDLGGQGERCSEERHVKCNSAWAKRWVSAVGWKRILGYNDADALGLLECLKDQLGGDEELRAGMSEGCRQVGLQMLERKREEVRANLASHFLGCI